MGNGIYTALSGAITDQHRVEMLSHNLANVNTPAFKRSLASAQEVLGPSRSKELSFAQPTKMLTDVSPGPIVSTDNPLDVALTGGVFMQIQAGDRVGFLRGGSMILRPDGNLVTNEGYEVHGEKGLVRLPPGARDIQIRGDGTIVADGNEFEKMKLVEFADEQALVQGDGRVIFDPNGAAGAAPSTSTAPVMAGYQERSNMNLVNGMTEMVAAQRHFDATMKAIQTFSQMDKRAARDIAGRV